MARDTTDTLTITKQPVQIGAPIADHAYKEPTGFTMRILQQNNNLVSGLLSTFSGNGLASLYKQFTDLQLEKQPMNVVTPKRVYQNMLIGVIRQHTDKQTENILSLEIDFEQIILVTIGKGSISLSNQAIPKVTGATQNLGRQSALFTFLQAFTGVQ